MQIGGYKYRAGTIYQTLDDVVTDSLLVMQRIEYEWRLVMKSPSCANKKELVARLRLPWGGGGIGGPRWLQPLHGSCGVKQCYAAK